ncbi:MAG: hypothetical protein RR840_00765 [Clostridium sp.]
MKYKAIFYELTQWRDNEIQLGNMEKAKALHTLSKRYKLPYYI